MRSMGRSLVSERSEDAFCELVSKIKISFADFQNREAILAPCFAATKNKKERHFHASMSVSIFFFSL